MNGTSEPQRVNNSVHRIMQYTRRTKITNVHSKSLFKAALSPPPHSKSNMMRRREGACAY